MVRKSPILLVAALTLLALAIRVAYVVTARIDDPLRADAGQYLQYGYNLAFHGVHSHERSEGEPTPDSFRSPGYPLLIAAVLRAVGADGPWYPIVLSIQALLSTLAVPLVFCLAREAMRDRHAAAVALLTALSPHQVTSSGYLLTETLQTFLFAGAFVASVRAARSERIGASLAAGMAFGLLYWTNETTLFLAPLWASLAAATGWSRDPRGARRRAVALLSAFVVFPAVWLTRGAVSVPADSRSTGADRALSAIVQGSYPGFRHGDDSHYGYPYRSDPEFQAMQRSARHSARVLRSRFAERPRQYLAWYLSGKPRALWSWANVQGTGEIFVYPVPTSIYESRPWARLSRDASRLAHQLALPFAALGVALAGWRLARRRVDAGGLVPVAVALTILYWTAIHTALLALPRYGVPLRPELYLLAVWAALELGSWMAARAGIGARQPGGA